MDKATWVGGPRDGQPVTAEELKQMTSEQRLRDYTAAVARLKADPDTWAAYQRERKELDGTAWAQERIAALEAALHALVDDDPLCFEPGDHFGTCLYCERWDRPPGQPVVHDPGCPVVKARALLKPSLPRAGSSDEPAP